MAFNPSAATTPAVAATNDTWRAQGFLNFYLPSKTGGRKKLGAIPLKESKNNEKLMLDWLNEDPARVAVILSKLEIEYQSAAIADTSGFALE